MSPIWYFTLVFCLAYFKALFLVLTVNTCTHTHVVIVDGRVSTTPLTRFMHTRALYYLNVPKNVTLGFGSHDNIPRK